MALNYTEADSPTNLTINNVCALLIFLMIIYSSSSSIATRCLSAWMSVRVLSIRIALVIMRCLKTVLIKIKEKDKWSYCVRPAYIFICGPFSCGVIRCSIEIGAKPFWAILQMTNELFHSWFAVHHNILLLSYSPRDTIDRVHSIHSCDAIVRGYFNAMTLIFMRTSFDPDAFHIRRLTFCYLPSSIGYRFQRNLSHRTPTFQSRLFCDKFGIPRWQSAFFWIGW